MQENVSIIPPTETQNIRVQKQPVPNASTALVMGIISIVLSITWVLSLIGIVLGIVGLVMGNKGLTAYNEAPDAYDESNLGQLKGGRVCSIIELSLGGVMFLFLIIYIVFVAIFFSAFAATQGRF